MKAPDPYIYTTAGERLIKAAHALGLCDGFVCEHYTLADYNDYRLTPAGEAAAEILLNAFYNYEPTV